MIANILLAGLGTLAVYWMAKEKDWIGILIVFAITIL